MQAVEAGTWTMPPGAPTIGTATGGNGLASVAFTAPAFTGVPAGVTGYTVTSSPGGLTGTGASSPISVTGLTNGTAYTFTVTATGLSGVGSPSAASNSVTPVVAIGDAFGGGFFAGQISTAGNGVADYNLVIGPVASTQSTLQWKTTNTATSGTSSDIDGPTNSANMTGSNPAGSFCNGLTVGGFSDWYMPAKNELQVCYENLKPSTNANGAFGINPNAIPPRTSTYTSGNPAQTAAAAFVTSSGAEAFATQYYLSSTEFSARDCWRQNFNEGEQGNGYKNSSYRVRAVRRVAV